MALQGASAVVVGAGLSGLSAAYKLQQAGFVVTVLERSGRAGGRVKTLRRDGFTIDSGPDAMTTSYVEYLKLVDELGLAERKVTCSQIIGFVRRGRVIDIDPARPAQAIFTPALSWSAKLKFASGLLRIRKLFAGVEGFHLIKSGELDDERESAHQFAERNFGSETADYLIDPLLRLAFGNGAKQCSRLSALGALSSGSAQLVNVKGGLDSVTDTLAEALHVVYEADVQSVAEADDGGVEVRYLDHRGEGHLLRAGTAVLATTYDVAERIYPPLSRHAGDYGDSLKFVPLISISLAYDCPTKSRAYAVLIPTIEQPDILLLFLQQNKSPDRVPEGSGLITLYTDPLAAGRLFKQSDEELTLWARREVERLCPELTNHFQFSTVSKWPVSGYTAAPGFWRRTRDMRAALPAQGAVQLAGDVFGAGSMESAVAWGVRAAGHLIEHHQKPSPAAAAGGASKISRSEAV